MGDIVKDFECILAQFGDREAVIFLDEESKDFKSLTYKDIKTDYEVCCKNISKHEIEKNCCIALLMTHNSNIPALVMSLQKLGRCFIFLNVDDSKENHLELLKALNIKWLITFGSFPCLTEEFTLISSLLSDLILWRSKENLDLSRNFENISYIIRTSGSTGVKKIVKVQNYCIYSNVKSIRNVVKITPEDIIYFGTYLTFDPSIIELFLALLTGATLLILPRKIHANPRKLFISLFTNSHNRGISFLQMSPSVFLRFSSNEVEFIVQKSGLKTLFLGGENFPNNILNFPRKHDLKIFNLYGITEVSCWSSIFEVTSETETIYLGTALADTIMEVRDTNGCCIQDGIGEMFIGSNSRLCIINDEEPFRENELVFRSTGDIVEVRNNTFRYIGRKNDLIKRYGQKIILSEIEKRVCNETQLFNICVWCEEENKLLLFLIIEDFTQKDKLVDKLRVKLLHILSKECFPDFIDVIKTIPLTCNGKVDKKVLRELFLLSRQLPESHLNGLQVFNELLLRYFGISQTKTDATFLEIGANSILLIQFYEEFKSHFSDETDNEFLTILFERNIEECRKFVSCMDPLKIRKRKLEQNAIDPGSKRILNNFLCKVVWKYDMKACVDCSPILINKSDRQLVAVGSFAHIFTIIDASSRCKTTEIILPETIEAACSVSACGEFLYVGCFDFAMYCIRINDGSIVWKFSTSDRLKCTPSLCKNFEAIVFGSYDKHLYCLNATDGNLLWKINLQDIINTKPIAYKEKILVATIVGNCFGVAESDGSIIWKYCTTIPVLGSPCLIEVGDCKLVCWPNVNGTLNCFSSDTGNLLWKYQASNQIFCSLLQYNGFVVFGCHDSCLYCLEVSNNLATLKYKVCLDAVISSASAVLKEKFIVTPTTVGSIFLVNLEDGIIQCHIKLDGQIFSSPCVCDNIIYIGCRDNNLYCLEVIEKRINDL